MPLGEMQIDGSYFEVAMTEQYLDRAQVGAGFKKVCGEAMAQGVRMDALVREACAFGGLFTSCPEDLRCYRIARRMPAVAGKEPLRRLAPEAAPVDAQRVDQLRAQHDVAVQATLASPDMNHHALTVNIADLQMRCFCATCPGGIKRH